ncbi:MAG: porin family protein [Henriciella sp.]
MQVSTRTLVAALILCALPPTAFAQEVYVEGLVGGFDTFGSDAQDRVPELDYLTLGARAGYELNEFLAIEGELMTGAGSTVIHDVTESSDLDIKLRSHAAVFGRVSAPLSERLSAHGRLGYGSLELSTVNLTHDGNRDVEQFHGPAFGFGTKFDLSDTVYVRADHAQYVSKARGNRVFTVGAGVNLFEIAKTLNDLRD